MQDAQAGIPGVLYGRYEGDTYNGLALVRSSKRSQLATSGHLSICLLLQSQALLAP